MVYIWDIMDVVVVMCELLLHFAPPFYGVIASDSSCTDLLSCQLAKGKTAPWKLCQCKPLARMPLEVHEELDWQLAV